MDMHPLVSIVIPVFNDADVISEAIESCLSQTHSNIEVIVVDDVSTDDTTAIVRNLMERDSRVKLVVHDRNASAFQARRTGIFAAKGAYLLFLDGDDELARTAVETSLSRAVATDADLVQFGVHVVDRDGKTGGAFEERLQPRHGALSGPSVLRSLFPVGEPAQGHVWRFLYRTRLLVDTYSRLPRDLSLPRVNDLPITFLAAALATTYVSVPDRLYRYHFGRGGSGQKVRDLEWVKFYASAIRSISSIEPVVREVAAESQEGEHLLAAYRSARLWIIGYTTSYLAEHTPDELLDDAFAFLYGCANASEIVHATASFRPQSVDTLAAHTPRVEFDSRNVRSILLTTNVLRTGGVSGVLLSQARLLLQAGFAVTIVARGRGSNMAAVPKGANFVEIEGANLAAQMSHWAEVCRTYDIDLVIDHHWLYSKTWHAFALATRAENAVTIGWAHNFAGRSTLLGLNSLDFQTRHLESLAHLIVLSRLDVAFWKLRGMPRVSYLPNPPSPLLLDTNGTPTVKLAPVDRAINLVWWGRLEQRTKRVGELITIAAELKSLGVDFHFKIIGPDWDDMSARQMVARAKKLGVEDLVEVTGPLYGEDLIAAIESSDLFVNASIIEGYPLTIPEAQAHGLPVVMYDMPWLALAEDNAGLVVVEQGDARGLATRIAELAHNPALFANLSAGAIEAARRELSYDFATLYQQLVSGALPREFSPEPTIEDAKRLIDLVVLFAEDNARVRGDVRRDSRRNRAGKRIRTAPRNVDRSFTSKVVEKITPFASDVIDLAPWLRRPAARIKHALLRR